MKKTSAKGGRSMLLHPKKLDAIEYQQLAAAAMSEAEFQANLIDAAKKLGWLCYHVYDSRLATESGFPDLVLLRRGQLLFVELKKHDGNLSDMQVIWLEMLAADPVVETHVWRPSEYDAIIQILARHRTA